MKLGSFGGGEASPSLLAELQCVAGLSDAALADLWTLLEPHLGPTVPDSTRAVAVAFGQAHGLTEDELVPIVRACRELFRTAAGLDVAVEVVASDLASILGAGPAVRTLTACYAQALTAIRTSNVIALLSEYGAVLDDVRLRVDYVPASRHDASSLIPIGVLSLRYRDDDQPKRLAVQVPIAVLAKLKALCDMVVALPGQR